MWILRIFTIHNIMVHMQAMLFRRMHLEILQFLIGFQIVCIYAEIAIYKALSIANQTPNECDVKTK